MMAMAVVALHYNKLRADDNADAEGDSCEQDSDTGTDTDVDVDVDVDVDMDVDVDLDLSDMDLTDLDLSDMDLDVDTSDMDADVGDTPPDDTDTPPDVTDVPPDVTDTPPDVTDTPPDVTDTPPDVTDTPTDVSDTPPDVTDTPPDVTDVPPDNTDTPPDNADTPPDQTDSPPPPDNADAPSDNADAPADNTDSPTDNTDAPPDNTDAPTDNPDGSPTDSTDSSSDSDTSEPDLDAGGDDSGGGWEEGANPFRVHDGNVSRKVRDLRIYGSTNNRLTWTRYHNTRPRKQDGAAFGGAGDWRHNWQYVLFETRSEVDATRPQLDLVTPSGFRRDFAPVAGGGWAPAAGFREKISVVNNGYLITTSRGVKLLFVRKQDPLTGNRYEMQRLTDRIGRETKLSYDQLGRLQSVVDPSGRSLNLSYKGIQFQRTVRVELATLSGGSGWQEFAVSTDRRDQEFDSIRVRLPDGSTASIAEIEVLSGASGKALKGQAKGSASSATAAFDGDTATSFTAARGAVNWTQLDLGRGKGSKITKIRVLATDINQSLGGAVIEGLYSRSDVAQVLDKVDSSDGRGVAYDYKTVGGAVALTGARYNDGAKARYTYSASMVATRPLLVEADDPHFVGRAKKIRYAYRHDSYDNRGMIHQEINPATGSVYVSLETDPADPLKRTVQYSDMRQIVYKLHPLGEGRIASRTDSLGRTTQVTYDALGRKSGKTTPMGVVFTYSYDNNNRLVRLDRNGKMEREYERNESGLIIKKTNRLGRAVGYTRNSSGRVTAIAFPDGSSRQYSFDQAGRVAGYKNRLGEGYNVSYNGRGLKSEIVDPRGNTKRYTYDSLDRRAGVTDALGRTTAWERNDRGQITRTVYPDARVRARGIDDYGRVKSVTNVLGRTTKFTRDELGRATRREDYKGDITTYEYAELPGSCACKTFSLKPTLITLSNGLKTAFLYDSEGRMLARTVAVGTKESATVLFQYDAADNRIAVTDALGNVTKFGYDDRRHRVSMTDPLGHEIKWTYDQRGKITNITRHGGFVTRYDYDGNGRRVGRTNPDGTATRYERDAHGRIVAVTSRLGNTTKFSYEGRRRTTIAYADGTSRIRKYDAIGRTSDYTNRDGLVTNFIYDAGNRVLARSDSLNRKFSYTYDDKGRLLTVTDPVGRVRRWTYNASGGLSSRTSRTGAVQRFEHDNKNHRISAENSLGQKTTYTRNAAGRVTAITDSAGKTRTFAYDERLRKTAINYSDGKSRTFVWDAGNHVVGTTTPGGLSVQYTYDAAGRLVSTSDSLGRKTARSYAENDRLSSITNALGNTARWSYDSAGRLSTQTNPSGAVLKVEYNDKGQRTAVVDSLGNAARFTYDRFGHSASLTDPNGNVYRYTRDARGRKTSMTYPDGAVERWTYDAAGRLTSHTNRAGHVSTITYNSGNQRLKKRWTPAGVAPDVTYDYDQNGRLTSLDNTRVKLTYTYDERGRVATETTDAAAVVRGLAPHTVTYRYDQSGRRSYLGYPGQGGIYYSYDGRGRLSSLSDQRGRTLGAYTYRHDGRLQTITRANGVVTTHSYDAADRLTDIVHARGTQILAASRYTVDASHRRVGLAREDGSAERYGYDTSGQLTTVDYGAGRSENFSYDAAGNRVSAKVGGQAVDYTTNGLNQYAKVGGVSYTYDANGNLAGDGTRNYRYDAENRLIEVEDSFLVPAPKAARAEFFYDAHNRCVARIYYKKGSQGQWVLNTADSRALTYDTKWNLLTERGTDGRQIQQYVHGRRVDEILVAVQSLEGDSEALYPVVDALGSTIATTDGSGSVTARYRYDVYGTPRSVGSGYQSGGTASGGFRFLFTGREWLETFKLNDHRRRYYMPEIGRWGSADPLGFAAKDPNLFRYAHNSVLNFGDPNGENPVVVGIVVCGLAAGVAMMLAYCASINKNDCAKQCGGSSKVASAEQQTAGISYRGFNMGVPCGWKCVCKP